MNSRQFMGNYLSSVVGIASVAAAFAAGFVAYRSFGILAAAIVCLVAFALILALTLVTGLGSRAAVAERDRRTWMENAAHLEESGSAAARIASMRIPDSFVKTAAELVALRSRIYIEACKNARSRDPRADEAITESLHILDLYLKELDDASTERRFGLPDDDPFVNARKRVTVALGDKAALLEKAAMDVSNGIDRGDDMDIKETLR